MWNFLNFFSNNKLWNTGLQLELEPRPPSWPWSRSRAKWNGSTTLALALEKLRCQARLRSQLGIPTINSSLCVTSLKADFYKASSGQRLNFELNCFFITLKNNVAKFRSRLWDRWSREPDPSTFKMKFLNSETEFDFCGDLFVKKMCYRYVLL